MFNVCPGCGEYSVDKEIDTSKGAVAVCRQCGFRQPFLRLPLLIITGASGTGKTAVGLRLPLVMPKCVCLESDILWQDSFNQPENDYEEYRNLWLRMAKNIGQSGRPVVLIGTSVPGQFEKCAESRYFSEISYLALVCNEAKLVDRLKSRPTWRQSGSDEVLRSMVSFNQWLINNAASTNPPMALLDTSHITVEQTVAAAQLWISDYL